MKITFNNVVYVVKKINNVWRFREYMTNNGWSFLRNAQVTQPALAQVIIDAIS